jgi:hypothetical protein
VKQISNIDQGTETTTTSGGYVRNSFVPDYEGESGMETRLSQNSDAGKLATPSTFGTIRSIK